MKKEVVSNMAYLIDEKKLINSNVFMFEDRIRSQFSRFLDKSPTYVTYYHINNIESIADNGFQNIERLLGDDSPVKFNKIADFPVYGLDQVILNLSDEAQGPDSSYEGEGIILPDTIKPTPYDLFVISYMNQNYIFKVSGINYDTIMSNNFYKITFSISSLDEQHKESLEKQISDDFTCIIDNIGTEEKVLIKTESVDLLATLEEVYTNIADSYKLIFFNRLFNSFLQGEIIDTATYDNMLTMFINKHELFNELHSFETVMLTIEDEYPKREIDYYHSLFNAADNMNINIFTNTLMRNESITNITSVFALYSTAIQSTKFSFGTEPYIRTELLDKIKTNTIDDSDSVIVKTVIKFFNNEIDDIYKLDMNELKNYMEFIDNDRETFILVPIVLFVMKYYYKQFMANR